MSDKERELAEQLDQSEQQFRSAEESLFEAALDVLWCLTMVKGPKGLIKQDAEAYINQIFAGQEFEDWWAQFVLNDRLIVDEDSDCVWHDSIRGKDIR